MCFVEITPKAIGWSLELSLSTDAPPDTHCGVRTRRLTMQPHHFPFQHPSWTDEPFLRETVSVPFSDSDSDSRFSDSLWKPWRSAVDSSSNYELFYYSPDPPNSSSGISYDDTTSQQYAQYWTLLLLIFPVFTAAGNGLVCASVFRERNLRTVTNYFIVSLAVADIMVAVLVMPLAVYVEVSDECKHFMRCI